MVRFIVENKSIVGECDQDDFFYHMIQEKKKVDSGEGYEDHGKCRAS